jgi:purine-binding chemotaxis protein CheW
VNTGVSSVVGTTSTSSGPSLLCRIGDRLIAVPLANVVETMRPLPVGSFPGTSRFVLGVATIRGAVVPVVDVACLAGVTGTDPGRFVTLAFGERTVALAVDAVIGVQTLDGEALHDLPSLLDSVDREMFAAIGTRDGDLLVVLDATQLIPESVWAALPPAGSGVASESGSAPQEVTPF